MVLKTSGYNYTTTTPDGTALFFNFYTLNLIGLKGEEASVAREMLQDPNGQLTNEQSGRLKDLFMEKGFLIDETIDEIALIKHACRNNRLNTRSLSLTIAPTLECNFRCTYCYQPENNLQVMTEETEQVLLRFAAEKLARGGSMHVTWFGGEPLLRLDIIERLTQGLVQACESAGAGYSASIITNGFLLSPERADKLVKMKIKGAQGTLDGPPGIHDERRVTKGGGATFTRILDNLEQVHQQLRISLRMNVDSTNQDKIDEMLDILVKRNLHRSLGFYIGQVKPYTDICSDVSGSCLSDDQFSITGLKTLLAMTRQGFTSTFNNPQSRDNYCIADKEKGFVIAPTGAIFKCWNDIGNPAAAVGHLSGASSKGMEQNRISWGKRDPFDLECGDCRLLPICMGGCPYHHLRSGEVDCHNWKFHTDQHLMFYYLLKKAKQQREIAEQFHDLVDTVKQLKTEQDPAFSSKRTSPADD